MTTDLSNDEIILLLQVKDKFIANKARNLEATKRWQQINKDNEKYKATNLKKSIKYYELNKESINAKLKIKRALVKEILLQHQQQIL